MTNTALNNKRYGFNAEAELLQYFREHGLAAERLHLTGTEDEGDLTVTLGWAEGIPEANVIVQLKTIAPRSKNGAERALTIGKAKLWLRALKGQREAYRAHRGLGRTPGGILVVKFRGQSWDDALVVHRLGDWASHD